LSKRTLLLGYLNMVDLIIGAHAVQSMCPDSPSELEPCHLAKFIAPELRRWPNRQNLPPRRAAALSCFCAFIASPLLSGRAIALKPSRHQDNF
jgi:hypothetical protein